MTPVLHSFQCMMHLVGIDDCSVGSDEETFFCSWVPNLVGCPAWNGDFTHNVVTCFLFILLSLTT